MAEWLVRAEEVERDLVSKKVLWARIQYFKNSKLLHDARFVPIVKKGKSWVGIPKSERIIENFIPPKRYVRMAKMAYAIIYGKQKKELKQLDLPF